MKNVFKLLAIGSVALSFAGCSSNNNDFQPIKESEVEEDKKIKANSSYTAFEISKEKLESVIKEKTNSTSDFQKVESGSDRLQITDTIIADLTSSSADTVDNLSFVISFTDANETLGNDLNVIIPIYEEFDGFSTDLIDTALDRCEKAVSQYGYGVGVSVENNLKLSLGFLQSDGTNITMIILTPTPYKTESEYEKGTGESLDRFTDDSQSATEKNKTENKIESETKKETASETAGQRNARQSARNYISAMPFSRSGLIEQLEYEGYSTEDATYAVDKLNTDWNEQAYLSAVNYLDSMSFSESGLIEQLEYEGYTPEQAQYGASKAYNE
ncbi:Ltp family lipoprotein [Erysipelotrichaceae bacterium 66-17]